MSSKIPPRVERRATYGTLTGIFLAIFTGFTMYKSRKGKLVILKPFDLVQVALASYRLGRLVSYDKVFETYRAPFTRTVKDPSGMGMTVEAKGKGARAAIGELICCPICAGTWIAAGLVYGLNLFPRATRTFLAIFSSIGAAEFINAATEALEWTGQLAREKAGTERAGKEQANSAPQEPPAPQVQGPPLGEPPKEHSPHDHFTSARVQAFANGLPAAKRING